MEGGERDRRLGSRRPDYLVLLRPHTHSHGTEPLTVYGKGETRERRRETDYNRKLYERLGE